MPKTSKLRPRARFAVVAIVVAAVAVALTPATQAEPRPGDRVVRAIESAAHPLRSTEPGGSLRDLRPLGAMVRDADVVGVGEATHNSREFFTMKHRIFRYLVAEKGFTTYSLETGWATGLRIDAYVLRGKGDIRRIMRQEFRGLAPWQNREYLGLFQWMRAYNRTHLDRQVRFMGNDINFPTMGRELITKVIAYVRRHRPEAVPAFTALYRDLRAAPDGIAYQRLPLAERQAIAGNARRAVRLLSLLDPDPWVRQHARSIAQTTTEFGFDLTDPSELRKAMKYRDRLMAQNTAWWRKHTGSKVLVSAHNGHIAYVSDMPAQYPKTQGAFLRDLLGREYLAMGFTFGRGSFNAKDDSGLWTKTFTVGPAPKGFNEYTLSKVGYRNYLLDMRTVPEPARTWLEKKRPTRSIGTVYPQPDLDVALASSHDILIHLDRITRAHPIPPPAR